MFVSVSRIEEVLSYCHQKPALFRGNDKKIQSLVAVYNEITNVTAQKEMTWMYGGCVTTL